MIDLINQLIDPKNTIIFKLAIFIVGYILSLWVIFCFWIFLDSQKRFKNFFISVFFFFLILIIGIPALFLYLIIRPQKEDENVLYLHNESLNEGGVNVPIVNFIGKDGNVSMSIQLKLNNLPGISDDKNMDITVDWNSHSQDNYEVVNNQSKKGTVENDKDELIKQDRLKVNRVGLITSNIRNRVSKMIKREGVEKTPELPTSEFKVNNENTFPTNYKESSKNELDLSASIGSIPETNNEKTSESFEEESNKIDKPLNEG